MIFIHSLIFFKFIVLFLKQRIIDSFVTDLIFLEKVQFNASFILLAFIQICWLILNDFRALNLEILIKFLSRMSLTLKKIKIMILNIIEWFGIIISLFFAEFSFDSEL